MKGGKYEAIFDMKMIKVNNGKLLKCFIDMPDAIYKGDANYVPYMRRSLYKTLTKLVLSGGGYSALLVKDGSRYVGRLLYNVSKNKQKLEFGNCGFFSMFESIDSFEVCKMLFDEMSTNLKSKGIKYIEGSFFSHDPDNRRGILINEFQSPPTILCSYNPPYYKDLLEKYGFYKSIDMLSYKLDINAFDCQRYARISERLKKVSSISIKSYSNKEEEMYAVEKIMADASTEINYQEAPSIDTIKMVAKEWAPFINNDFIKIAIRKTDGKPLGFVMAVPDFNQVFIKMQGRINLITLFRAVHAKRKINSIRGILQYVIPEYQSKGLLASLYAEMFASAKKHKITNIEAGTVVENNEKSNEAIKNAGGELYRVYRIYGKRI